MAWERKRVRSAPYKGLHAPHPPSGAQLKSWLPTRRARSPPPSPEHHLAQHKVHLPVHIDAALHTVVDARYRLQQRLRLTRPQARHKGQHVAPPAHVGRQVDLNAHLPEWASAEGGWGASAGAGAGVEGGRCTVLVFKNGRPSA